MAEDTVILAEGLGKKYLIGHQAQRERYVALRDVISEAGRNATGRALGLLRGRVANPRHTVEEFWALRDVDFQVRRGQVLGVIGRNGAGKSTLLKILSRITEPSAGKVTIHGRIASLLEVGTGFHPELTGRENIFLNGSILGMRRQEIRKCYDEIVAFAEVERFLDTPVKRYSSGMYVRLAFSVAAHLQPDILVVDEVLAVGDAEFQKKCLGKLSEVAGGGRTVLFVSHNMASMRKLCDSAILLDSGRIEYSGGIVDTISAYMSGSQAASDSNIDFSHLKRSGSGKVRIESARVDTTGGSMTYRIFEKLSIRFSLWADNPADMPIASLWLLVRNSSGDDVLMQMQKDSSTRNEEKTRVAVHFESDVGLPPGTYSIACGLLGHGSDIIDWIDDAFQITVEGSFDSGGAFDSRLGLAFARAQWRVEQAEAEAATDEPDNGGPREKVD